MKAYQNLNGNSGVIAYETGNDFIKVEFIDGSMYLYSYKSAGEGNVEKMKKLANEGIGLSAFISTTVKDGFEKKL